jgi:hypothetical protein
MIKPFHAGAAVAPFGTYACYACAEKVLGSTPSRAKRLRALFLVATAILAASLLSRPAHAKGEFQIGPAPSVSDASLPPAMAGMSTLARA